MQYQYYQLSNGIRIIHRQTKQEVAHCGLMVNTGSRDELLQQNGMAHLIEHMIFKGTRKRKAYHVLSRLEHVGGELNAFTTKEETCIHASFTKQHYERTLELFADVAFQATYPVHELEKEKDVILDEINSYRDTPSEEIFDEFENLVFDGHPIGRNILGTEDSIKAIKRNDILRFIRLNYSTNRMVLSSVGNIAFDKLVRLAQKYFGDVPEQKTDSSRHRFENYQARFEQSERQSYLSHCVIGNLAFERNNPLKHGMILLNNILGGPGMNSRLYMNIREKFGFTYAIESHYHSYSDTGLFVIYLGTDPKSVDKTIRLVMRELNKLRSSSLGSLQLHRAKQQLIGQLAISFESGQAEMLSIARSHLIFEQVDTMQDVVAKINRLSAAHLLEIANTTFHEDQLSTLIFKGKDQ
jgi:predicted Zn-dependent peptidase